MRRFIGKFIFIFSLALIGGCAPDARNEGSKVVTPVEFPRPNLTKEGGYRLARGATYIKELSTVFDPATKTMRLMGRVEYIPMKGESLRVIDIDLSGNLDESGFVNLKGNNQNLKNGEKIAAKSTCLSERGTCEDSFIDLYVYVDNVVYHHQIESHQEAQGSGRNEIGESTDSANQNNEHNENEVTRDNSDPKEPKDRKDTKNTKNTKNTENTEDNGGKESTDTPSEDDVFESEGDSDIVEGEPGQFVGTIAEDIETLLEIKPDPTILEEEKKAAEETEKEDSKTEGPQKVEPKKEEPKKEEPKKVEPKREEPKKEEPKKAEPKKEEPKKVEPKKEESTNGEPPKEEFPKAESRNDAPKMESWLQALKVPQSIGPANNGRLQNAVDMVQYEEKYRPTGFHIIRSERKTYFATNHILYLIAQMGQVTKQNLPGYSLAIGDISYKTGGRLGRHLSHQTGLDADIAYYFNNKTLQGAFTSALAVNRPHPNWMFDEQWKLFKFAVKTQLVDRIFIHRTLKKALCSVAIKKGELKEGDKEGLAYETLRRLHSDEVHHNHFHLRVKFSVQPGAKQMMKCSNTSGKTVCRKIGEPAPGAGCF